MAVKTILVACLLGLTSARSAFEIQQRALETVPELDTEKYLGRWYQAYGNRLGWLSYGDDAVCITATYNLLDENTIAVYNHNRKDIGTGFERFIRGQAGKTEEPGKFTLLLDGVPFEGTYWVLKLGPVIDDMYDFAVVTSSDGSTLFILTRNLQRFAELYEEEVLAFVEEQGFTGFWTAPVPDFHPDDCVYPPLNP